MEKLRFFLTRSDIDNEIKIRGTDEVPFIGQRYFSPDEYLLPVGAIEEKRVDPYETVTKIFTEEDSKKFALLVEFSFDTGWEILHAIVDACFHQCDYA